jgi:hypothetical protein
MARAEADFSGSDQYWIHGPESFPDVATWDQSNGLAVTADHGAVILTSEYVGSVHVTVDPRDARPTEADDPYGLTDGQSWDEIVEISLTCEKGPLLIAPLDDTADLPRLDTRGPGSYRLRVHARNRDVPAYDADGLEFSTDAYLIVSWPENPRPALPIRLTDQRGFNVRLSLLPPLDAS